LEKTVDQIAARDVLSRGKIGYEAIDVNDQTVGTFASQREAAAALQTDRKKPRLSGA